MALQLSNGGCISVFSHSKRRLRSVQTVRAALKTEEEDKVKLSGSNLTVTKLGIRTFEWDDKKMKAAKAAFDTSIYCGTTFFDTAEVYGSRLMQMELRAKRITLVEPISSSMALASSQQTLLSVPITKSNTFSFGHEKTPLKLITFPDKKAPLSSLSVNKRTLSLSIVATLLLGCVDTCIAEEETQLELKRYTDSNEGFTVFVPSSWIKVDKAGATALFEERNKGSNNLGIVVSPVRLESLGQFGSPEFVADKLIQAEKRKESTNDAKVIKVAERSDPNGLQVYEFEYKVDSTRGGIKRIFSAAFVSAKKLYILNIAHSDKPESPLDNHTRNMLEQVLHSFDTIPTPST